MQLRQNTGDVGEADGRAEETEENMEKTNREHKTCQNYRHDIVVLNFSLAVPQHYACVVGHLNRSLIGYRSLFLITVTLHACFDTRAQIRYAILTFLFSIVL